MMFKYMTIIRITFMQSSHIFSFPYSMYPFIIFAHPLTLADEKRQSGTLLINSWRAFVLHLSLLQPWGSLYPLPVPPLPSQRPHSNTNTFSIRAVSCSGPAVLELGNKAAEVLKPEEWGLPSDIGRETNWSHNHCSVTIGIGFASLMSRRAPAER